jgi:hypothetical protein
MKTVVYTVITGNYDKIVELEHKEKNVDYICFTNNKDLKSKTWKMEYISEDMDNWLLSRKVKIQFYKYVSNYDISIYMDGAVKILKPITEFLSKECDLDNNEMICFKHQQRDCIYDELNANIDLRRETVENVKKVEEFLIKEKYPKHNGLIEATVLVRKNTKDVRNLMDAWFGMLNNYSKRDQLSFNYCVWKHPVKLQLIDMWVMNNKYFKHMGHNKINYLDYRLSFNDINEFDFHYMVEDKIVVDDTMVKIEQKCLKETKKITLLLPNEIGNIITNIKVNNKKNSYELINSMTIDKDIYFFDLPSIVFIGDFKKGETITISFNIKNNSKRDLVEELFRKQYSAWEKEEQNKELKQVMKKQVDLLNQQIKEKDEKYETLLKSYNDIINSKA